MSWDSYSLIALEREMEQLRLDLIAFSGAYELLKTRIIESKELQPPRQPELHTWSGSRACVGALEMAGHAIERTIAEYNTLIEKVRSGEIKNTDPPPNRLSLVKE